MLFDLRSSSLYLSTKKALQAVDVAAVEPRPEVSVQIAVVSHGWASAIENVHAYTERERESGNGQVEIPKEKFQNIYTYLSVDFKRKE